MSDIQSSHKTQFIEENVVTELAGGSVACM